MTVDFKKAEILNSSLQWSLCTLGLCSLHHLHTPAGNGSDVELLLMLHVCSPAGKIMHILTTLALSPVKMQLPGLNIIYSYMKKVLVFFRDFYTTIIQNKTQKY
jgi:hypothetical protein